MSFDTRQPQEHTLRKDLVVRPLSSDVRSTPGQSLKLTQNILVIDANLKFSMRLSQVSESSKMAFSCFWEPSLIEAVPVWNFCAALINYDFIRYLNTHLSKRIAKELQKVPFIVLVDDVETDIDLSDFENWNMIGLLRRTHDKTQLREGIDTLLKTYYTSDEA